jgi:hypothetical protein
MKKKKLIIIILIGLAIPFIFIVTCLSGIWYSQTHTGTRNGQVFDANTGKPIEGSVVNYTWHVTGFMEDAIGGGGPTVSYETLTDKEGKYYIPNLRIKRSNILQWTIEPEIVLVYKDKYAAYELFRQYKKPPVGRSFGYLDIKQPYSEKNNNVRLYPFKESESHDDHIYHIRTWSQSSSENKLLLNELKKEERHAYK